MGKAFPPPPPFPTSRIKNKGRSVLICLAGKHRSFLTLNGFQCFQSVIAGGAVIALVDVHRAENIQESVVRYIEGSIVRRLKRFFILF
ncbi:hypothetical protein T03_3085, partial [Trichinella britovi]